jgi:hypothetical protein
LLGYNRQATPIPGFGRSVALAAFSPELHFPHPAMRNDWQNSYRSLTGVRYAIYCYRNQHDYRWFRDLYYEQPIFPAKSGALGQLLRAA